MLPIVADKLSIGYKSKKIADNITFSITQEDFIAILGPNGSGKTTLVKTILGIIPPIDGEVSVFGCPVKHVCPHRKKIGYVPQIGTFSQGFPSTLLDVVISGLFPYKNTLAFPNSEEKMLAKEVIEKVGLLDMQDTPIGHLSGGQQKRGLLARALIGSPDVIILDEPTSGVDISSTHSLISLLIDFHEKEHIPIVVVTHDINPYYNVLTKFILIGNGKFVVGKKEQIFNKELLKDIYGNGIEIIEQNGRKYLITGDYHNA